MRESHAKCVRLGRSASFRSRPRMLTEASNPSVIASLTLYVGPSVIRPELLRVNGQGAADHIT